MNQVERQLSALRLAWDKGTGPSEYVKERAVIRSIRIATGAGICAGAVFVVQWAPAVWTVPLAMLTLGAVFTWLACWLTAIVIVCIGLVCACGRGPTHDETDQALRRIAERRVSDRIDAALERSGAYRHAYGDGSPNGRGEE